MIAAYGQTSSQSRMAWSESAEREFVIFVICKNMNKFNHFFKFVYAHPQ